MNACWHVYEHENRCVYTQVRRHAHGHAFTHVETYVWRRAPTGALTCAYGMGAITASGLVCGHVCGHAYGHVYGRRHGYLHLTCVQTYIWT